MRRFRNEDYNLGQVLRTTSKDRVDAGAAPGPKSSPTQVSKLLGRQVDKGYDLQEVTRNSSKHKLEERRKKLNDIYGHGSKDAAGRPTQSQSTPNLPDIGQPLLPKPTSLAPTGSQMLDSVLGKLNKPKLLNALDRLVKEVCSNKKTLKVAFREFDLNGDGILSKEEMAIQLRKMGVSLLPSELDAVMRALDVDQNGLVELDEVIEIVTAYRAHFRLDEPEKVEAPADGERENLKSPPKSPPAGRGPPGRGPTGAVGGRRIAQPGKLF